MHYCGWFSGEIVSVIVSGGVDAQRAQHAVDGHRAGEC